MKSAMNICKSQAILILNLIAYAEVLLESGAAVETGVRGGEVDLHVWPRGVGEGRGHEAVGFGGDGSRQWS